MGNSITKLSNRRIQQNLRIRESIKGLNDVRYPSKISRDQIEVQSSVENLKTKVIEQDGRDPQFDEMLRSLGQKEDKMLRILESRNQDSFNRTNELRTNQSSEHKSRSTTTTSSKLKRLSISQISDLLSNNRSSENLLNSTDDKNSKIDLINHLEVLTLRNYYNAVTVKDFKNSDPRISEPLKIAVWVSKSKK
ncbi:expressed protein [Phakopsora pachyrhizi]|uniref:Expressed protein n=1 Tax=Phakopsora pachyrhizi TaxID=170000 RepID=A0AAV0BFX0_PHAPC|nr:expressed protein [Phakopsora pachyrhizi]